MSEDERADPEAQERAYQAHLTDVRVAKRAAQAKQHDAEHAALRAEIAAQRASDRELEQAEAAALDD